jgi:hypothetical protein
MVTSGGSHRLSGGELLATDKERSMRKMVYLIVMLSFAAIAAGQSKTSATPIPQGSADAADSGSARNAIVQANARFLAAMKRGDAKTAAANYAEDAIVMMPGEPAWKGRAAIQNGLDGFLKAMTMQEGARTPRT